MMWEWMRRTDCNRPWQNLPMLKDEATAEVFKSLANITVGNGLRVMFWTDRWIDGLSAEDIAPRVVKAVGTR
jgi:hypothetical protein